MSKIQDGTFKRSKHDRQNPYTQISNAMLRDKNLSIKSKGTLCYLLSMPDDWTVNPRQVADSLNIGKDQIYGILTELIKFGYCRRTGAKGERGKFAETFYEFSESTIFKENSTMSGNPDPENPDPENQDNTKEGVIYTKKQTQQSKPALKEKVVVCSSDQEEQKRRVLKKYALPEHLIKSYFAFPVEHLVESCLAFDQFAKKNVVENPQGCLNKSIHEKWKHNHTKQDKADEEQVKKDEIDKKIQANRAVAQVIYEKSENLFTKDRRFDVSDATISLKYKERIGIIDLSSDDCLTQLNKYIESELKKK